MPAQRSSFTFLKQSYSFYPLQSEDGIMEILIGTDFADDMHTVHERLSRLADAIKEEDENIPKEVLRAKELVLVTYKGDIPLGAGVHSLDVFLSLNELFPDEGTIIYSRLL